MHVSVIQDMLLQIALALLYYASLVTVMRLAGKRLAGQTTTFDLVILITISVVLQTTALRGARAILSHGIGPAVAGVCARSNLIRRIVRGCPRPLIQNACVDYQALASEGLSYDELLAGLRKLGYSCPEEI